MSKGKADEIVKTWDLIEKAYNMQQSEIDNSKESLKMWNHSSTGIIFALWALDVVDFNLYKAICRDLDLICKYRMAELANEERGKIDGI